MRFLKKLFGKSDANPRANVDPSLALVPTNDSNEEILSRVLSAIWLAEMGETRRGRELSNKASVGPRITAELEVIQSFRRNHGHTYQQLEHAFWCSDFVRDYHQIPLAAKTSFLKALSHDRFLSYVSSGKALRPRAEADGVVYYLITVAFEILGVDPAHFPSEKLTRREDAIDPALKQ